MSKNVLSEDEIEALAGSVSRGEIAVGVGSVPVGEIQIYNFMKPDHIMKATLPILDVIHQQFAKSYQSDLLGMLHKSIEITAEEVQLIKFGDYLSGMPILPCVSRLVMKPADGDIFFNIDAALAYSVVDAFFGGSGEDSISSVDKEFTHVEKRVIQRMITLAVKNLKNSWEIAASVDFKFVQHEARHQIIHVMDAGDLVFVSRFICKIGKDKESWFHICIPHALIEPFKPVLYGGYKIEMGESSKEWVEAIFECIQSIPVEVTTIIAESEVSLKKILNAVEGDFIAMDMKEQVVTYAGDVPLFRARMGVSGGFAAIQFANW